MHFILSHAHGLLFYDLVNSSSLLLDGKFFRFIYVDYSFYEFHFFKLSLVGLWGLRLLFPMCKLPLRLFLRLLLSNFGLLLLIFDFGFAGCVCFNLVRIRIRAPNYFVIIWEPNSFLFGCHCLLNIPIFWYDRDATLSHFFKYYIKNKFVIKIRKNK